MRHATGNKEYKNVNTDDIQDMGKLNLPPIERRQYGRTPNNNPDYVEIPETIQNNIPKMVSNYTDRSSKIHVTLLDALNQLNQLKLLQPGKLYYKLETMRSEQYLTVYAPKPPEEQNGPKISTLFGHELFRLNITKTGIFTIHSLNEKATIGTTFREWLKPQLVQGLEAFSEIKYKPSVEETGEWFVLNKLSQIPQNKTQTAHITLAATDFRTKVQLITLIDYELPKETIEMIKAEDPTGLFIGSIILMYQIEE